MTNLIEAKVPRLMRPSHIHTHKQSTHNDGGSFNMDPHGSLAAFAFDGICVIYAQPESALSEIIQIFCEFHHINAKVKVVDGWP